MKLFNLKSAAFAALILLAAPLAAQNVKIDYRLDTTGKSDSYFTWTAGHNAAVKDGYDASTGASLNGTTSNFNIVRYDSMQTNKQTIPSGLRCLFLFPMSAHTRLAADNVTITENGKTLIIRFIHRDSAYEITTDSDGRLNIAAGVKKAAHVAANKGGAFEIKPEYLTAGGDPKNMASFDWSKAKLLPETKDAGASRWYEGALQCVYTDGILTVTGTMTEKK